MLTHTQGEEEEKEEEEDSLEQQQKQGQRLMRFTNDRRVIK
jgi:hypothetical protein